MPKILACFRQKPTGLTLGEISKLARINKSRTYRLLSQMALGGLVERTDDGRYVIGHALFQLGVLAHKPQELRSLAHPVLYDMARDTGETASLAVLEGADIVFIGVVESFHEFRVVSKIGSAKPFHLTAMGKAAAAFLTEARLTRFIEDLRQPLDAPTPSAVADVVRLREELKQARRHGYALSDQEYLVGVRAVAAPVFSSQGEVEAAVGISGPASRLPLEKIEAMVESIVAAADSVTESLGRPQHMIRSLIANNAGSLPRAGAA